MNALRGLALLLLFQLAGEGATHALGLQVPLASVLIPLLARWLG